MKMLQIVRSVRFALTLWYSLVLLAAFLIFGASVYVYLQHVQEKALRQDLFEEVDWISRLVDVEKTRLTGRHSLKQLSKDVVRRLDQHYSTIPRNYVVVLASLRGSVLYQSGNLHTQMMKPLEIPRGTTSIRSLEDPIEGAFSIAARRVWPFAIQVGYTEKASRAVLGYLLFVFALLVPVVLFVSFAGGWFMAGLVLRPIDGIADLTKRITAENLNERIPPRAVDDELGRLIATINGMIARLQSSFEQMREFSLSVAHELKTPLTILKGESELALERSPTPEETQQLASSYLEETVRMSRIVDDLLTLAKADAGRIVIGREPVQLDGMIQELFEDTVVLSGSKRIRVELVENQPAIVLGDATRLRQMLRAIVSNAVRYTDPEGLIRITSRCNQASLQISIEDTGIGIPPESLDKIFQRFYRVDADRSRASGGSGLGLSIARWIADAHGGSITVRSTPGKGSCFIVNLPLHAPPENREA
jgi:heavy metal sensor kinase